MLLLGQSKNTVFGFKEFIISAHFIASNQFKFKVFDSTALSISFGETFIIL